MNIQTILVKRRLVKTLFLLTSFLVAAMFIGSAASTGVVRTSTTPIEKIQTSEADNIGQLTYTTSQEQMKAAHDVALTQIISPTDGIAGTKIPEVTVANVGENDESVNVSMQIGKTVYTLYLEEYFEGTFPPSGWTNQIIQNHGWVRNDQTSDARPNYAGGQGYCADADADTLPSGGPWPMECALISPLMDLSTVTGAVFSYTGAFNSLGGDYADVDISIDGGTTWTNLVHWAEDHSASGPGEDVQLDISSYCGNANVQVRFLYFADSWDWYYEVDNVKVYTVSSIEEYNEYVIVDINAGETMNVTLPQWTPADINVQENITIDYIVGAQATITDDENPSDNTLSSIFSLHFGYFHDVAITEIISPTNGPAQETTPEVVLANNGQNNESVNVNMYIEKIEYSNQWTQQQYSGEGIWERWNPEDGVYCQPAYGSGSFMAASSDDHSGWSFDVEIFTYPMDMTGETSVSFSCAENFQDLGSDDTAQIGIYSGGVLQEAAYYQYGIDDPSGGGVVSYNFDPSTYPNPSDVQIGFYYSNGAGTYDWGFGIDDVLLESATVTYIDWNFESLTFPPAEMSFLFEYDKTVNVSITAGESMNVVFPDWTPSDITLSIGIDYRVTATATLAGFITIGSEGFEYYTTGHYAFPAGWTIQQTNPSSTWFVYGTGTTHTSYCQETGSQNLAQNELLITPTFNFAGMDNVKLQYSAYFYRAATNGDSYVEVLGSLDGGSTWPILIKTYNATGGVSYNEDIDISSWAANQPSVTIGYRFTSDADVNLTDYFYFDNFWVGNAISLMTEGFNTYTPGYYAFPSGWAIQQSNPTSTWFVYTTGTTAKCQETGAQNLSQDELLISPTIDCSLLTVVRLQYYGYFYNSGTGPDTYVQVLGSIDGGTTWPTLIKNYTAAVAGTNENFDISSWAVGQANVKIGLRFVSTADTTMNDYFYLDDFWVGTEQPMLYENFSNWVPEHYNFPANWTIQQTNAYSTWFVESASGSSMRGRCQETNSQNLAQSEKLITPVMDLTSYAVVKLLYNAYYYKSGTAYDYVNVYGSTDGGTTWSTLIKNYTATATLTENIDISSWAAGQANVKIRFLFNSTADSTLSDYFYVDNFLVCGNEIPKIYENFSNYIGPSYGWPSGWTVQQTNPTTWIVAGTPPVSHTPKCTEVGSNSQAQNELLLSPTFNFSALATNIKLQYQYYWYRASPGDSYCEVRGSTDGGGTWPNLIANYSAVGTFQGYADFDITSWAAGQASVKIGYHFVSTAESSLADYFWFDGFCIGQQNSPVFSEYFEGTFPPTGWTRVAHQNTLLWQRNDYWATPRTNYAGTGFCADADADKMGSGGPWPMNTSLISGPIDLSSVSSAVLKYRSYYYLSAVDDYAKTYISIDNGTTWTLLYSQYGTLSSTLRMESFDITPYCGNSQVKLRFQYYSNGWHYYWEVDNVTIEPGDEIYTSTFKENPLPANWGPLGWSGDSHWVNSATTYAGGTSPELKFSYSPYATGNFSFATGPIDTSAYTQMTLSFKNYVSHTASGYTLKAETSTDGVTWNTVWSVRPLCSISAYTVYLPLTAANGIGSSTFRFRYTFSGYTGYISSWYIDNIHLSVFPIACTTSFDSPYVPTVWGPLGWTTSDPTHWMGSYTNYAGGTSPELKFYWSPSFTGNSSIYTGPIDTSAYTALSLVFKHYVSHSSTSYNLTVDTSIDGVTWTTVWKISPTGSIPASNVVIPLTTAEGIGSSTFRLAFTFRGSSVKINNWNIDNIRLARYVTAYTTSFNTNYIPANWGPGGFTDVILQGTHGWLRNDLANNRPNYAGGDGYCADADSDAVGSGGPWPMDCALITPLMDLTAIPSAMLSYIAAYNDITTGATTDYANVDISIDGGISWTTLSHWDEDHSYSGPGEAVQLDISPYCGNANVQIRFHYFAPGWDWYYEVDNVKVATVSTIYNTTFNENWIPTSWGPAGWQQVVVSGTDVDNEWDVVTTGLHPSGVLPHSGTYMAQYDSFYISSGNSARLYLPNPIDFSSFGSSQIRAKMWMYHDPGYSTDDDRVEVQLSLDGTTWNTVGSVSRYATIAHWEEHTFDFSAYATEPTVYIGFLGISEYGNSIYIDDLSLQYYGEFVDGNPSDNELVKYITLTFVDDVGVTAITQPTGPEGNWPPGTYDVAGVVGNLGSFTEYNVLVNTKIWKLGAKADELFYEENVTVPVLAFGGSEAVTFPDVTFENADEGNFRLEMRTMLAGDDHPENDKLTKTFVIQAPDTTPPVTTAELTGTMGQNNWYISTVIITLTATDPEGKIAMLQTGDGKWPMGVNHTYYKIDSGIWTEYLTPFNVSSDGPHTVSFYSDDKAIPPNVEEEKNVSFKMDKTAPNWINYSFTPQNVLKNKWLCAAEVEDVTSGIVLVEFFVDDAYVGNDTTAPYEFEYSGKPTNNSQALATDAAGNTALSPIATSLVFNAQQYTQQFNNQQSTPSTPKLG